jgi:phosphoenolpyruvate carboxykinase (GTP)
MWPGFGENLRVLRWIIDRCDGQGKAVKTPIGFVPTPEAIDLTGLNLTRETLQSLLEIHPEDWKQELQDIHAFFEKIGDRLPKALREEAQSLENQL